MALFSFLTRKPTATAAADDGMLATVNAQGATVGARPLVSNAQGGGYSPTRVAEILEAAQLGDEHAVADYWKLADAVIERELHTSGVIGGLATAVAGLIHKASPPKGDASKRARKIADEFSALMSPSGALRLEAQGLISKGITHGLAVASVQWDTSGVTWRPVSVLQKPSHFFTFSKLDGRTPLFRNAVAGQPAEPLQPGVSLVFAPRRIDALQIKNGLAWVLCWAYVLKSITLANESAFVEAFGAPIVTGKYNRGATPADISALRNAVAQLSATSRAVFREDLGVQVEQIAKSGSTDIYEKLCRYLDELISKVVFASTLTSDAGGSGTYALGKVHAEGKYDTVRSVANQWAAALQVLAQCYTAWNYGEGAPVPTVSVDVEEAEDLVAGSQIVKNLTDAGVTLDAQEIRERFGYRTPEPGAEVVGGAPAAQPAQSIDAGPGTVQKGKQSSQTGVASHFVSTGCPVHSANAADGSPVARDALDDLADQMLADYEVLTEAMDATLLEAAANATSEDDLRARVMAAVNSLDTKALAAMVAKARTKSAVAGDLGAEV